MLVWMKSVGAVDGTVDMALGREIDHRARTVCGEQIAHRGGIADVARARRCSRGSSFERGKVFQVARIGQLVQIDHGLVALRQPIQHEVRTDETRTASH